MGFFRQKYLRGLPFPPAGALSKPGFKPTPPASETYGLDVLRRMCAICRHLAPRGKKIRAYFLFLFFPQIDLSSES